MTVMRQTGSSVLVVALIAGLIGYIQERPGTVKLRPDHSLVYMDSWHDPADRVAGIEDLLKNLGEIAGTAPQAAQVT